MSKAGVECYAPNQFARQFGMTQAVPLPPNWLSANTSSLGTAVFCSVNDIQKVSSRFVQLKEKISAVIFDANPKCTPSFESWWSNYIGKTRTKSADEILARIFPDFQVPSSSRWKNKSKTDVGGDSSDDHSENDEAVQFYARIKSQREHAQSPGIHVQSPALKKSQCSEQVLDKTEAEVHKILMMPLNEVVLPENQSTLLAALPRYAASPHFSVEKARAVEELKKNLPSLFSDYQQMKKQQEECTRKADKKMFLTDHLTKRQELYNGLKNNSIEIDNSIYSIKSKIAELQAFLEEAMTKKRAIEELELNCQKQCSAILVEFLERIHNNIA